MTNDVSIEPRSSNQIDPESYVSIKGEVRFPVGAVIPDGTEFMKGSEVTVVNEGKRIIVSAIPL